MHTCVLTYGSPTSPIPLEHEMLVASLQTAFDSCYQHLNLARSMIYHYDMCIHVCMFARQWWLHDICSNLWHPIIALEHEMLKQNSCK